MCAALTANAGVLSLTHWNSRQVPHPPEGKVAMSLLGGMPTALKKGYWDLSLKSPYPHEPCNTIACSLSHHVRGTTDVKEITCMQM